MWDRLIAITDEIVSTLVRTSFSTIVSESYDLTVVVLDAEGHLVAQGSYSIPVFIGTAPLTLKYMLQRYPPETLRPGDILVTNDPWLGTGHIFDICVMRPVFRKGQIVAYTMSITHLPDIGGIGFSAAASEIYQEGLRLPVVKLVEEGRINPFLVDLIRVNVRVPEQTMGDILANVTCNEVGSRFLLEFMDEYGIDDLGPLSRAIRETSEAAMREKIGEMKPGTYENEIQLEGIDEPITLACRVEVGRDTVEIDLAGTGPAVRRGINVPFCYANAMALYSIKCLTIPSIPNNEGSVQPVRVTAPEGCILNAMPPSPTGGRHIIGHFVSPLIFGALAEAAPDKVQADCGMIDILTVQGRHRDGRDISTLFFASGGFGSLEGHDGPEVTPGPSNMAVVPVEVWESLTSMTVKRKSLTADSGGPGAARGGLGQEVVLRNDTGHPMTVFCMANRTEFPALGFGGGRPGARRETRINGATVHPKGDYRLEPGGEVTLLQAGGGGWGDPADRPPELLRRDLENGLVTPEGARRDYGVDPAKILGETP
jgi:N-methylhydantoinase B